MMEMDSILMGLLVDVIHGQRDSRRWRQEWKALFTEACLCHSFKKEADLNSIHVTCIVLLTIRCGFKRRQALNM